MQVLPQILRVWAAWHLASNTFNIDERIQLYKSTKCFATSVYWTYFTQYLGYHSKVYLSLFASTSIHIAIINQATFWSHSVPLSLSPCVCLTFWKSVELFQTHNKNGDCFWIQHNKCVSSILPIRSTYLVELQQQQWQSRTHARTNPYKMHDISRSS